MSTISTRISFLFLGLLCNSCHGTEHEQIDPCNLKLTFSEEFDQLRASGSEIYIARWFTHTPWFGDFGDAQFVDPSDNGPFFVNDGFLTIQARKSENGRWTSGILSSADPKTAGFAQAYGYFEARMKLPQGPGVWPAFWLASNVSRENTKPTIEIDVIEYYGVGPDFYHSHVQVWNKMDPKKNRSDNLLTKVAGGSLSKDFHTYGVRVASDFITFFLDRKAVGKFNTPPEHKEPLLILINLALGSGWPIDETPNPSNLVVDYIRSYSLESSGERGLCQN